MAEQPKPVKNSLLSATSSSFFEDAALFVPVPLVGAVEAQGSYYTRNDKMQFNLCLTCMTISVYRTGNCRDRFEQ